MSNERHPAIRQDARLKLRRPPPAQPARTGSGARSSTMRGDRLWTALNRPSRVGEPPTELEVFPKAEIVLCPRSIFISHQPQSAAAKNRQRPAGGKQPRQHRVGWSIVAAVRHLERPPLQDLASGIDRRTVSAHQQGCDTAKVRFRGQRFGRPLQAVERDHNLRVEKGDALEPIADLTKSSITAAGETTVEVFQKKGPARSAHRAFIEQLFGLT